MTPTAQYEGPDAGYAVAALAADSGTEYSSYSLLIRSRDKQREADFVWLQVNMFSAEKPDFSEPGKAGVVRALSLAPGDYELYSFSVFQNGYPATMTYGPKKPFEIPFSIKPGQATYLGEYLAIATYGENLFGSTVKGGPVFIVSDQAARDMKTAKDRIPAIATVQAAIPTAAQLHPPLFASKPPGLR